MFGGAAPAADPDSLGGGWNADLPGPVCQAQLLIHSGDPKAFFEPADENNERWKELKDTRPEMIIGVGGCVASQEGELIRERAPYVDLVFGPQTLHRLPSMLDELRAEERVSRPEAESEPERKPPPEPDAPRSAISRLTINGFVRGSRGPETVWINGDRVERGDVIAKASGFVSSRVHATAAGTVKAIEHWPHPAGAMQPSIRIAVDPHSTQLQRPRLVPHRERRHPRSPGCHWTRTTIRRRNSWSI